MGEVLLNKGKQDQEMGERERDRQSDRKKDRESVQRE